MDQGVGGWCTGQVFVATDPVLCPSEVQKACEQIDGLKLRPDPRFQPFFKRMNFPG